MRRVEDLGVQGGCFECTTSRPNLERPGQHNLLLTRLTHNELTSKIFKPPYLRSRRGFPQPIPWAFTFIVAKDDPLGATRASGSIRPAVVNAKR